MDLTLEQITRKSEEQIRKTHYKEMLLKPYEEKVNHSKALVHEFVNILGLDNVYVSTSGGKDSACLSRLCKNVYPNVKHIMFNTGLDYKHGVSKPISLWCDNDVEQYIQDENVELSMLYTQYEQKRTGCVNCPYGAHIVKDDEVDESRFEILKKLEPKRYEYFMHTKLRRILAMSNVPIPSDEEYTKYKDRWQKIITKWRKRNKSNDNYLTFKCRYALQYFTGEELKKAVIHISRNELKYDLTEILKCIDEVGYYE